MSKQTTESLLAMKDFRPYVRSWAQSQGRGEFRRISIALGMHTTQVSQVFNSKKCLTEEQACRLCHYMGLNQTESDYFLKLVQLERAGHEQLRATYSRHLREIRNAANEVTSRVPQAKELSSRDQALFYSSWQYSLVRLLSSIDCYQTKEEIALRLKLSLSRTQEILSFLTSRGLCRESEGKYQRTEKNTHVSARSPLAVRHHQNWRGKSFALIEQMKGSDLVFTAPVSLAKKDFPKVRAILLEAIAEVSKVVESSVSEEIAYLAIDWLEL